MWRVVTTRKKVMAATNDPAGIINAVARYYSMKSEDICLGKKRPMGPMMRRGVKR
jgi:chromosomal replication initiation ATPase DnaA